MKITDMEYGYCFHVYLRKYSETDWSSLLWNMINVVTVIDADAAKKDRVWSKFCEWCDKYWKENPETPFYDVAVKWTELEYDDPLACPMNSNGFMFKNAILLLDKDTRNDLNSSCEYDLEN